MGRPHGMLLHPYIWIPLDRVKSLGSWQVKATSGRLLADTTNTARSNITQLPPLTLSQTWVVTTPHPPLTTPYLLKRTSEPNASKLSSATPQTLNCYTITPLLKRVSLNTKEIWSHILMASRLRLLEEMNDHKQYPQEQLKVAKRWGVWVSPAASHAYNTIRTHCWLRCFSSTEKQMDSYEKGVKESFQQHKEERVLEESTRFGFGRCSRA
jgi:hypothetical protein